MTKSYLLLKRMSNSQGLETSYRTDNDFLMTKSRGDNENSNDRILLTDTLNMTPVMKNTKKRVNLASGSTNLRNTGGFITDTGLSMGNNNKMSSNIVKNSGEDYDE